jgi:hypothetical protein
LTTDRRTGVVTTGLLRSVLTFELRVCTVKAVYEVDQHLLLCRHFQHEASLLFHGDALLSGTFLSALFAFSVEEGL